MPQDQKEFSICYAKFIRKKDDKFKEQTDYEKIAELVENIFWDIYSLIQKIEAINFVKK